MHIMTQSSYLPRPRTTSGSTGASREGSTTTSTTTAMTVRGSGGAPGGSVPSMNGAGSPAMYPAGTMMTTNGPGSSVMYATASGGSNGPAANPNGGADRQSRSATVRTRQYPATPAPHPHPQQFFHPHQQQQQQQQSLQIYTHQHYQQQHPPPQQQQQLHHPHAHQQYPYPSPSPSPSGSSSSTPSIPRLQAPTSHPSGQYYSPAPYPVPHHAYQPQHHPYAPAPSGPRQQNNSSERDYRRLLAERDRAVQHLHAQPITSGNSLPPASTQDRAASPASIGSSTAITLRGNGPNSSSVGSSTNANGGPSARSYHPTPTPRPGTSAHPHFRSKTVCTLSCRHCDSVVCSRGMKAILLGDLRVELFSTDTPPSNRVQLVDHDYMTRNCRCRIRDVACLGCGNVIGYHVTQPCDTCLDSCNNGHFWMFLSEGVKSTDRMDLSGTKNLVWAQLPCVEMDELGMGVGIEYELLCR